jgi:CRP-like cAMP-binding protein
VRQATVTVSSSHADLYYLERDEFDALLGSYAHVRKWLAFRNVPALASVSDQDLHEMARHVTEKTFEEGETVCAFGANADEMFVVESGASAFFRRRRKRRERGLDACERKRKRKRKRKEAFSVRETSRSSRSAGKLLRAGEWFGERALMGAETTRAIEVTAGEGESLDSSRRRRCTCFAGPFWSRRSARTLRRSSATRVWSASGTSRCCAGWTSERARL